MAVSPKKTTRSAAKAPVKGRAAKSGRPRAASSSRSEHSPAAKGRGVSRAKKQEGGFAGLVILLVGLVVLASGAALWFGMERPRAPERYTVDKIDPPKRRNLGGEERSNAVIRRALQDMSGLPYEEALTSPVEEGVKQVDFAIARAMAHRNLPPGGMTVEQAGLREDARGEYHFQRIHIAAGKDADAFLAVLREALGTLADRAYLSHSGGVVWDVRVDGVLTHELVMGGSASRPRDTHAEGPGRVLRRRAPGAPAFLVIVMDDLGQSMPAVRSLLALPYRVTFAVWPYATHAREAARAAHATGREVIVHQPMEPMGYPEVKPGPGAVFISDSESVIAERIRESLRRVPHAVGLNNHMGSKFTRSVRCVAPVLDVLREQGLFMLDSMTHPGSSFYAEAVRRHVPGLRRDVFLDVTATKSAVLRQLRRAEEVAHVTGQAIAIGHPLPETLAALKEWRPRNPDQLVVVSLSDLVR